MYITDIEFYMYEIESILKKMGAKTEIQAREGAIGFSYQWKMPQDVQLGKSEDWEQLLEATLKVAPIRCCIDYEKRLIYVEFPKSYRPVKLMDLLQNESYVKVAELGVIIPIGKNLDDQIEFLDLIKEGHLLITGSTGTGKSVLLHTVFAALTYKHSPDELQFLMMDLKDVEYAIYRDSPYLYTGHVTAQENVSQAIVNDKEEAMKTFEWLLEEMERRYALLVTMCKSGTEIRSLSEYNFNASKGDKLPRIIVMIDEMADLMFAYKNEMDRILNELLLKAAAVGIHIILSTQCSSVNVITETWKSKLAAKIAFSVCDQEASKAILGCAGAEKLMSQGDALYMSASFKQAMRIQTPYIRVEDALDIKGAFKKQQEEFTMTYMQALKLVVEEGRASISLLQRNLPIGYNKAVEIIEWMEGKGYIGPFTGSRYREVYLTKEKFEKLFQS